MTITAILIELNIAGGNIQPPKKHRCHVGASVHSSICVDWITGNIYWTDGFHEWIGIVSGSDPLLSRIIHDTNMVKPTGIAVDPINGYGQYENRIN